MLTLPARIFLIGYRGTGKTALGEALARRLGYGFVDTDRLLEERLGRSIAEYFASDGEAEFRKRETEVLEAVAASEAGGRQGGLVVATGGGIVTSEANVALMRRSGCVVWLTAPIETIRRRLSEDAETPSRRPALRGASAVDEVERVLTERLPLYRAAAHITIATEGAAAESLAAELAMRLARISHRG